MRFTLLIPWMLLFSAVACAQNAPPATAPAQGKLPHLAVDVAAKRIAVECEALNVTMPLEFFCVVNGTSEHESVLRSPVKPSDLHLALLMIGLQPGEPVHYSPTKKSWLPPHGPPLQIFCEYQKDGQTVRDPAYRWMRNVKTKEPMPPLTWIFAGSRVMPDGVYAADTTGYLVSVVNFDLTVIDIPALASSANETLEWEYNPDVVPPSGTKVTMILEPAGKVEAPERLHTTAPTSALLQRSSASPPPGNEKVTADEARMQALRQRWQDAVRPHDLALREAAQAHYEVINELRREQHRLIDEADRIQRLIDQLEKDYQDMTTPRPEPVE